MQWNNKFIYPKSTRSIVQGSRHYSVNEENLPSVTTILKATESGVLGMHNIVDRPAVIDGEIKIRPIMYLALSYDHRIIDGKESVSFLKMIKENLEDPRRLFLDI